MKETSRNSGPEVDEWLAGVGLGPGYSWCAAWVYAMHDVAARACGVANPCPRTAGALRLWALADPACRETLAAPGDVFVLDHGHGLGHVGIVELVTPDGETVVTIEGNTNAAGSREGDQVAKHTWRPSDSHRGALVGYLSFEKLIPDGVG
jgi:hypothetical protein